MAAVAAAALAETQLEVEKVQAEQAQALGRAVTAGKEKPSWVVLLDPDTHEPYYWNKETGVTSWSKPSAIAPVQTERERRIEEKRLYYLNFIGPVDAAKRAEVEVDEELDAEEEEATKGTKEQMRKVFDRIDENGNGLLDAEELRKLSAIIDPDGLSSTELESALLTMDSDGSADVDFEEFFEWCVTT